MKVIGDWTDLPKGSLIGLPREPPVGMGMILRLSSGENAEVTRSDVGWTVNGSPSDWFGVIRLLLDNPDAVFETVTHVRECGGPKCQVLFILAATGRRKRYHRDACRQQKDYYEDEG
ncbi:MAG: hypothetical protein ACRDTZ_10040 [Pseudonocardiaceae bacterium]